MEDESELLALRRARLDTWRENGHRSLWRGVSRHGNLPRRSWKIMPTSAPCASPGRLISKREMGKNVFAHIQDETGKLQVYAQVQGLGDKFAFWKLLDIGDFIGGEGTLFTTKTGEKTVAPFRPDAFSRSRCGRSRASGTASPTSSSATASAMSI